MRVKYGCKFPNCKNRYYQITDETSSSYRNKKFYRFPRPKRRETLDKWKEACNIKEDERCFNSFVCEDHFLPLDFANETRHRINYQSVPRDLSRLLDDKVNISWDHTYIRSENEDGTDDKAAETERLEANEPCNLTTQSDDIYDTDDEALCDSYAQITFSNVNLNNAATSSANSSDSFFLHYDKYEFLSSPFQCRDKSRIGPLNAKLWDGESIPIRSLMNMNMIHLNIMYKLQKLKKLISEENEPHINVLFTLCKNNMFRVLLKNIEWLTDPFVSAKSKTLRCSNKEWDIQNTMMALYLYKHGTRFYVYLLLFFNLPSMESLERIYLNISFKTGLDPSVISTLQLLASNLDTAPYCYVAFDKMVLDEELVYEGTNQLIYGYQDMGHLGRSHLVAKYALVFMVCGLEKSWKQIVAYYFMSHVISNDYVKHCITEIISQLQAINFKVVATICKHSLFSDVMYELCEENSEERNPHHYFLVNNKRIVTIFDVPCLLKDTREAFLHHNIVLESTCSAKFVFIKETFNIDANKRFKNLPNLKKEHFIEKDVDLAIAKAQLSSTAAANIETLVIAKIMSAEAVYTADFISIISDLYDSICCDGVNLKKNKYGPILSQESLHVGFWMYAINLMDKWKVVDKITGHDNTNSVGFIKGWQTTLRSILFLWRYLTTVGYTFFNLKLLDQQKIKDVFDFVKKYNKGLKENPTCFQFANALKQYLVEDCLFLSPTDLDQYKDPFPLCNLAHLWIQPIDDRETRQEDLGRREISEKFIVESILNSNEFKDIDACYTCKQSLLSHNVTESTKSLYVVNDVFTAYLGIISDKLHKCLGRYSYKDHIEDRFEKVFLENNTITFCEEHSLQISILKKVVPLLIGRFVRDFNQSVILASKKYSIKP